MAEQVETPGTAPVVDRRPVPRGVLPKGVQTWLMAALAIGVLGIIFLTGQPNGPAPARQATAPTAVPSTDRVRDYQERLRMLDEQSARDALQAAQEAPAQPTTFESAEAGSAPAPVDPLVAERRRRDYESLFASNWIQTGRRSGQRAGKGRQPDSRRSTRLPTRLCAPV